jgi:hypothetical protein
MSCLSDGTECRTPAFLCSKRISCQLCDKHFSMFFHSVISRRGAHILSADRMADSAGTPRGALPGIRPDWSCEPDGNGRAFQPCSLPAYPGNVICPTTWPITGTTDCETTACTSADVAKRDQQTWSGLLTTLLPKATASIKCASKDSLSYSGLSTDQLNRRPPYGGNCAMTISWGERGAGDKTHSDTAMQTFAWEFQP